MVGMWSLIRQIDQTKTTWAIKARAARVYREPAHDGFPPSLEVIFHDEEGSKIHAHVPDQFVGKFHALFTEGRIFAVKNFMVEENFMFFKTTTSAYRLRFFKKTEAFEMKIPFPLKTFSLVSFSTLHAQDSVDDRAAIDIIGQVVHDKDPKTILKNDRPKKLIELILGDTEGNVIACTLWGPMVEMLVTYKLTTTEPIVMLLQCCRARKYQGQVHVSNMFNTTKVILNGSEEVFNDFKTRMAERCGEGLSFTISSDTSSEGDISSGQIELVTIDQLTKMEEDGKHWVYGEIAGIDSHRDWSYVSCIGCNCKVSPNGYTFQCLTCNTSDAVLRYKVNIRVVDKTSHASFLLWDREVSCLIGRSAASLKEQVAKRNFGPHYFPSEINALMDIKALFRVQYKMDSRNYKGNQTFSVLRMNTDPRVIALYVSETRASEDEDEFTLLKKEFCGTDNVCSSQYDSSASPPLLNKQQKMALKIDGERLKKNLFGESSTTVPMKKMKGVKIEEPKP
ncbi:unnamed protein product [Cuscuta epithymum]|uniref:Replication factor A C-terminal domain-containing protein n=1 Tax=Cuscuta epithymum TaxID=186058 RepID=A0AAV0C8Q9_9ASTE|nr:unnamed protein product [Cuscuta epithymum]